MQPLEKAKTVNEKRRDERRKKEVAFNRRKFDRRGKEFIFKKTVYLNDTNSFGNSYFASYFVWQGAIREDFFKWLIDDYKSFMKSGIKLVTKTAHIDYKHECYVYDDILITMKVDEVRKASGMLNFQYKLEKTNQVIADGFQKITFTDPNDKVIAFPEIILSCMKNKGVI